MFKRSELKNGTRLITVHIPATKSVTVLALCRVGSRQESKTLHGGAHLLEHLFFKGTKKRPDTLSISKELDAIGAEYNAFTSKEFTGYYIKSAVEKVEISMDVLSDMLLNSKFDPTEMEREKKVVCEEIKMYEENPLMHIEEMLYKTMYDGDSLGRDVAGTQESVTAIDRTELMNFKNHHYVTGNMVIVVAGGIKDDEAKVLAEKYFQFPEGKEMIPEKTFQLKQTKPQIGLDFRKNDQVQLMMGFPGYADLDPKRYAARMMSVILGENMSSRLFINVRERRGLCYLVRSSVEQFVDTGYFVVHAGLDKARIEEAIKVILEELYQVKEKGVTNEELKKAKDYVEGQMILGLEDSSTVASFYGFQELIREEILTPEEKLRKIQAVTLEEVHAVAKDLFKPELLNISMIGPVKKEDKILKVIS